MAGFHLNSVLAEALAAHQASDGAFGTQGVKTQQPEGQFIPS